MVKATARFLTPLFLSLLLGATPGVGPTNPAALVGQVGRPVRGFVFAPMRGSSDVLRQNGRPTVVVLFASWCGACVTEMPRIVTDAAAFGDAVNFIGIDYGDGLQSAEAFIAKNHILFPTELYDPDGFQRTPRANALVVHVPGGRLTSDALEAFKESVPPQTYDALVQIAEAQQAHSPEITSLESRLNVYVTDIGALPAEPSNSLALPRAFVIDARGILREDVLGYDSRVDRVRSALDKLGLRAEAER